jgi:hypothetical protein
VRIRVEVDGEAVNVEGEDVLAWLGERPEDDRAAARLARRHGADYVRDNPRPEPDAQGGVNVPARQRMALLRRLAAGPATRAELLAAMRAAAGYVGAHDWRNRYDELRGHGKRGGGHTPLPLAHDPATDVYRLTAPFPVVRADVRDRLGLVKAVAGVLDAEAAALLEGLLPGLPAPPREELRDALDTLAGAPADDEHGTARD